MSDTQPADLETGTAVGRLAVAVQTDLQRIASLLGEAHGLMQELEAVGNLVPGLSSLLKPKRAEVGITAGLLLEASDEVPKKLAVERISSDSDSGPTREPA